MAAPLRDIADVLGEDFGGVQGSGEQQDPSALLGIGTANLLSLPGAGGGAPTGLDLLRNYAKRYLPDPVAMRVAQNDAVRAYEEQAAAIEQQSAAARAAPWFAFAGGMGQPTQSGHFAEAAGNASAALGKQLESQAGRDALAQREAAILRSKAAGLPAESMQEELKVALPALSRMTAANRLAGAKRFEYKKTGTDLLVFDNEKIDSTTGAPTLIARYDADDLDKMYQTFYNAAVKLAEGPTAPAFTSAEQRQRWIEGEARRQLKEWMDLNAQLRVKQPGGALPQGGPAQPPGGATGPAAPPMPGPAAMPPQGGAGMTLRPPRGMTPESLVTNMVESEDLPMQQKIAALEALKAGRVQTPATPAVPPAQGAGLPPAPPSQILTPNPNAPYQPGTRGPLPAGTPGALPGPVPGAAPAMPPPMPEAAIGQQNAREIARTAPPAPVAPPIGAQVPPQAGAQVPGPAGDIPLRNPVEEHIRQQGLGRSAHNDAERVKLAQEAASAARSLRSSAQTALSLSDKAFAGPTAEAAQFLAGIAASIAPDSKLSDKAGFSEAYVANIANLVRDKIQALGTANAISNADLLFTEKSLGSLRTTVKGRRAILTALMLDGMTLEQEAKAMATWFHGPGNGTLKGYTSPAGGYPLFAVGKKGIVSFEAYRNSYRSKFPNVTDDKIVQDWREESVRGLRNLITGEK